MDTPDQVENPLSILDTDEEKVVRRTRGRTRRNIADLEGTMAFGYELKRRRLNAGYRFATELVEAIKEKAMGDQGISLTYLSQIERGYRKDPDRPVTLSDEKMKIVSEVLDWPLADMYRILRRLPAEDSVSVLTPGQIRDAFAGLPSKEQIRLLKELMATISTDASGQ